MSLTHIHCRIHPTVTPTIMVKVLAILYKGGKGKLPAGHTRLLVFNSPSAAEEEPRLLGTVENKLGIADWLKEQGHE